MTDLTAHRMVRAAVAGAAALALATASGCGEDEEQPAPVAESKAAAESKPAAAKLDPDKDPYTITCADLADPLAAAEMSRRATVALARKANIRDLSQLRASQSIFFAMTELCKENGADYKPARDAVAAVKDGTYRADLGAP